MEFTLIDNRVIICGKTSSGKSVLLKHMLQTEASQFHKIFVVSPTEPINAFYSDIVPAKNIYDNFSDVWLKQLIAKMTEMKTQQPTKKPRVLIIFDDCGVEEAFYKSPQLKTLVCRGRHLGIACVFLLQYLYQVPPVVRSNASFVCVGQMNQQATDLLADEFSMASCYTKKEFISVYHKNSKDYRFFLIKCNSTKNNDDPNEVYGSIRCPMEGK